MDPNSLDFMKALRGGDQTDKDFAHLEARIDHLSLVCRALWSFLYEQGVTEEEFLARVQEIDLLDGKLDNRLQVGPRNCPGCQRVVNARHRVCMYCGENLSAVNPFDRI